MIHGNFSVFKIFHLQITCKLLMKCAAFLWWTIFFWSFRSASRARKPMIASWLCISQDPIYVIYNKKLNFLNCNLFWDYIQELCLFHISFFFQFRSSLLVFLTYLQKPRRKMENFFLKMIRHIINKYLQQPWKTGREVQISRSPPPPPVQISMYTYTMGSNYGVRTCNTLDIYLFFIY